MMKKLKKAAGSQETSIGSKKRTSARHELRVTLGAVLGAVVSFLAITFMLGYHLGRSASPNWEDTFVVRDFMDKHLSAQFVPAGRQSLPESDPTWTANLMWPPIELSLQTDDQKFTYRTDTPEKIAEYPLSVRDRQAPQSKDYHESVNQGGTWALSAGTLLTKAPLGKWLVKAPKSKVFAAAMVIGAGGVCGFYVGYTNEPKYHSKRFQEMLHEPLVWRGLAEDYRHATSSRPPSRAAPSATP
jgi:hypothetical protein